MPDGGEEPKGGRAGSAGGGTAFPPRGQRGCARPILAPSWKEKENTGVLVKSQGGVSSPGLPFHPIFKFFRGAGLAGRDRDPPPAPQRPLCPRRGRGRGPGGASPSAFPGGAVPSLSLAGAGGRISLPQIIKGRGSRGGFPPLRARRGHPRPLPPSASRRRGRSTAACPERESGRGGLETAAGAPTVREGGERGAWKPPPVYPAGEWQAG